jgi:hypothetical protein
MAAGDMIINAENLQIKNVEKRKDDEDVIRQGHDNQQIIRT